MTNINKKLREKLLHKCEIKAPTVAEAQHSSDGTIKWAMNVGDQRLFQRQWGQRKSQYRDSLRSQSFPSARM